MKHNYKFRIDEPAPTDEQIKRHQNFDQVLADYRNMTTPLYRRPLYRNPRAFLGLMLILVIAFLVFQAVEEEEEANELAVVMEQIDQAKENHFLAPATMGFEVTPETFTLESGIARTFELPSGAVVRIPENAFPTGDAPVEISVREYTEPLAAILAGIPLNYDDNNIAIPSQIFEIKATRSGNPITLAPDAEITIEMTGPRNPETEHDVLYVLDLKEKTWKSSGKDVSAEERALDSPHSPVIIHDGFNVIEYEDDGSIRNQPITPDEGDPTGEIQWIRSFESTGNGYFLCGRPGIQSEPNLNLRLTDTTGKTLPVFALYQVSADGQAARTYWPEDSKFTYHISTSTPGSKLFAFTEAGQLAWAPVPPKGDEEVVTIQPEISTQPIQDLATLKSILGIEAE